MYILDVKKTSFFLKACCYKLDEFVGNVSMSLLSNGVVMVELFEKLHLFQNDKFLQLIVGTLLQAAPEEGQAAQPPAEVRPAAE